MCQWHTHFLVFRSRRLATSAVNPRIQRLATCVGYKALFFLSGRPRQAVRILRFDVFSDHVDWRPAAGYNEIGRRPEVVAAQFAGNFRKSAFANGAGRRRLDLLDNPGEGYLRAMRKHAMQLVGLAVGFHRENAELGAGGMRRRKQRIANAIGADATAMLDREDGVGEQQRDGRRSALVGGGGHRELLVKTPDEFRAKIFAEAAIFCEKRTVLRFGEPILYGRTSSAFTSFGTTPWPADRMRRPSRIARRACRLAARSRWSATSRR